MDFIKNTFTIKDLENLSGVKKHTIRIWEKRYNLLSPQRTETNIRYYSTQSLMHLLNIVLLYNNGYKISKIAELNQQEIFMQCKNLISEQAVKNQFINDMKIAMLNFDQERFETSFRKLNEVLPFQEIFQYYFLPFFNELGLLWQTNIINPAHEHFISHLIKQKILTNTEKIQYRKAENQNYKFVLFLPDNEIHDLGITYLNFEIMNRGFKTIFLGQSVPLSCLTSFTSEAGKLIFISYFTVKPEASKVLEYLEEIHSTILSSGNSELWVLGYQAQQIPKENLPKNMKVFESTPDLLKNLNLLI